MRFDRRYTDLQRDLCPESTNNRNTSFVSFSGSLQRLSLEHYKLPLNVADIVCSLPWPQTLFALAKLLIKMYQAQREVWRVEKVLFVSRLRSVSINFLKWADGRRSGEWKQWPYFVVDARRRPANNIAWPRSLKLEKTSPLFAFLLFLSFTLVVFPFPLGVEKDFHEQAMRKVENNVPDFGVASYFLHGS